MSTKYTVVQFVPDPIADERINIGIIAWNGENIRSLFLKDWRRVKKLAGEDFAFAKAFAEEMQEKVHAQESLLASDRISPERLEFMISEWSHSIQFSDVRGSLEESPVKLLSSLGRQFLKVEVPMQRGHDKRWAASNAYNWVLYALESKVDKAAQHIKRNEKIIKGNIEDHAFDIILLNSKPVAAAEAISFRVSEQTIGNTLRGIYWDLDDIKKYNPHLDVVIYAIPPKKKNDIYKDAVSKIKKLNADVLTKEDEVSDWARQQADRIAH